MRQIIASKYTIIAPIGAGSFGTIFRGEHSITKEPVAIKFESSPELTRNPLSLEYRIYKVVSGATGFAELKYFGNDGDNKVIVFDLFSKSIEKLFSECHYHFSLKTVLMLADQMITRIEYLHKKSICHRDVKPDNFVMGLKENYENNCTKSFTLNHETHFADQFFAPNNNNNNNNDNNFNNNNNNNNIVNMKSFANFNATNNLNNNIKNMNYISTSCSTSSSLNLSQNGGNHNFSSSNFLNRGSEKSNVVHLIDFGLAKKYRDLNTHVHSEQKNNRTFIGTARFASINAHKGHDQSRRDDIESLAYTLLYLVKGGLPWMGINCENFDLRSREILKMKEELMAVAKRNENLDEKDAKEESVNKIEKNVDNGDNDDNDFDGNNDDGNNTNGNNVKGNNFKGNGFNINGNKMQYNGDKMKVEAFFDDIPVEFKDFLVSAKSLEFDQEPDYAKYRSMFRDLFISMGYRYDYIYDWNIIRSSPFTVFNSSSALLTSSPGAVPASVKHYQSKDHFDSPMAANNNNVNNNLKSINVTTCGKIDLRATNITPTKPNARHSTSLTAAANAADIVEVNGEGDPQGNQIQQKIYLQSSPSLSKKQIGGSPSGNNVYNYNNNNVNNINVNNNNLNGNESKAQKTFLKLKNTSFAYSKLKKQGLK